MSNPTPPASGEWTAKLASHGWYVEFDAMNGACIDNELTAKAIANAHNAALAAVQKYYETVRYRELIEHEAQLREQLATAVKALRFMRPHLDYEPFASTIDAALAKIKEANAPGPR